MYKGKISLQGIKLLSGCRPAASFPVREIVLARIVFVGSKVNLFKTGPSSIFDTRSTRLIQRLN